MNLPPIRIILVDDHELVRNSWKLLLNQNERFTIIGECKSGAEAIEQVSVFSPDIILMDINMYPITGLEATEKITAAYPGMKIIGLSINTQPVYAKKMIRAGAQGYITKNAAFSEIEEAIMEVYSGRQYICKDVLEKM